MAPSAMAPSFHEANPAATTVMVRVRFEVDDPVVEGLVLRVKYDDGYVAWLNGVEVARRNVAPGVPGWRSEAQVHDDGAAVRFEDLDISRFADDLRMGENVLAIQVVNTNPDSSDLLLLPEIVDGLPGGDGPLPPAQGPNPEVTVEEVVVAGAESYVVLENRERTAVDLSRWQLVGRGIEHGFAAGTVIPTGGRLYVVANVPAFRDRGNGPGGGQGLLVQGNWGGPLAPDGELRLEPAGL